MTRAEKRRFVRELVRNVGKNILAVLPDAPEEWDGHEIRMLIRDHFGMAVLSRASNRTVRQYNKDCRRLDLWGSRP